MTSIEARRLPGDWFPGEIPANVALAASSYVETTYSFRLCRSLADPAVTMAEGSSAYVATMFDLGPAGQVRVGRYSLLNGVRFICDASVDIGDHCLLAWNVVVMDSYRMSADPRRRRQQLLLGAEEGGDGYLRPVSIADNVWIGMDACILPGVHVGEGSVVAARAVVVDDVPPYTVAAGNPARVVRSLERGLPPG
ncbi:MAG: acyltransferase [Actinobacteria bacterium]|nr:acyltransferase [Actinomycetota bacterium]